jgi:hypothetical protein
MEPTSPDPSKLIAWHPAFIEALQMELEAYRDVLEFHPEDPLTSAQLEIDCVVIKKAKDAVIRKNIASVFREWNIIEYKSPADYVSVADFYKIYGYACLYISFKRVPVSGVTVSFVENHYPKALFEHFTKERGYKVAESGPGIYTVSGDILPIQVIESGKLPEEEYLWLKNLNDRLDYTAIERVSAEAERDGKTARLKAYLEAIARANSAALLEAIKMGDALTVEQVFEEVGWTAKWEARGEARGRAEGMTEGKVETARNFKALGVSADIIVKATGMSPEEIAKL